MNRKAWLTGSVLVAIGVWMMVMPLSASAVVHTNADCALCHGAESIVGGANMDVGSVNKATACRKCHLDSLVGTHPNHYGGGNCGAVCHPGWGPSLPTAVPLYLGANGAFAAPDSELQDAGALHAIHATPRWMANKSFSTGKCGSCHATAACTACHNSTDPAVDITHANHGDYGNVPTSTVITPWVGNVSVGVASSLNEDTMLRNQQVKCGSPVCHNIASIDDDAPKSMDTDLLQELPADFLAPNVTKTGTWRFVSNSIYQAGLQRYSNDLNASYTFTFSGERVELIADKDPYRGVAAISIDGSAETTISLYNATTRTQRKVWRSGDLGAGTHTIRVRVAGSKEPASRGNWVSVDGIKIHGAASDTISPTCGSCHAMELPDEHGGDHPQTMTFSHDVTQTIAPTRIETDFAAWDGVDGYACTDCHTSNLRTDHRRSYASGMVYIDGCAVCHPTTIGQDPTRSLETSYSTYRRSAVATVWTDTYILTDACNYPTCHVGATVQPLAERTKHGQFVSKHTTNSAGESPACSACHPGDLRQVHNNPIPGNAKVEDNGCLSCHAANRLDLDKSCSKCHIGGYASVTATGHAIKDSAAHNASETGKPFTRAYQGGRAALTDGGFECVACHTSQLVANHSTPGTMTAVGCSTGGAGGKGCHMDTALDSIRVAGSGWTARKCSDCHSGTRSHDNTATPHLVGSNGCAGSAAGCHPSNDLWALHAISYAGGAPKYQNCADAGCHDSARINKRPALISFADSCGTTSPNAGCHNGLGVDHVMNFQHTFTAASQYNGGTETGCTYQSGCHNAGGVSTADYGDDYHPASGCFSPTGKCHVSASKAAFTGILPTDCQECHNGTFAGAQSRNNLTQPLASGGHYSDTTHTAAGMAVAVNSGGSGSATCANCHAGSLMSQHATMTIAGSPYGGATSCGECHADTRANGNAQVVANWTNNTCVDCHTAGSTSPLSHATTSGVVAEVGSTCGSTGSGCHNNTDLHSLHKNTSCNISGCHNYALQSQRPSIKGCGGAYACHTGYSNNNYFITHTLSAEASNHAPTAGNIVQANATWSIGGGSYTCTQCHIVTAADGGLMSYEHTSTYSAKTLNGSNVCLNCHNHASSLTAIANNWSARNTTNACGVCHTGTLAIHTDANAAAHVTLNGTGCASTGIGCHNSDDLSAVGATATAANTVIHNSCVRCHLKTGGAAWSNSMIGTGGNLKYNPNVDSCGQATGCHTSTYYTTSVHRSGSANVNGNDALAHTATGMNSTITSGVASAACSVCHSSGLLTAHDPAKTTANLASGHTAWSSTTGTTCQDCHNANLAPTASAATQVKGHWTNNLCVDCHTPSYHNTYVSGHVGVGVGCVNSGGGCHATADLAALHGKTKTNGCALTGCHDAVDKAMTSAAKNCGATSGGCHAAYTETNHGAVDGHEATHTATGMTTVLDAAYNAGGANTCQDCHSAGITTAHNDTSMTASLKSLNTGWNSTAQSTCYDCHNATTPDNSVTAIKTDSWSAKTCDQCHVTRGNGKHQYYVTGHVGTHAGYSCNTCHATDDLRDLHNNPATGNASTAGCDSAGCHDSKDKAMGSAPKSCGTGNACHTDMTDANHGSAGVHMFTSASNYSATEYTETGCNNSGAGCHGANATGDYATAQLHGNMAVTCVSSLCHTDAASKTAHTSDKTEECVQCHTTGVTNYNGVTARSKLTSSPASGGHYSDTTHTAVGMTATINAGGTAGATCNQCHSPNIGTAWGTGLMNQHYSITPTATSTYGTTVGCGDCHNDTTSFGQAQEAANWTNNTCADCHKAGSKSTLDHAAAVPSIDDTMTTSCGATGINCHNTKDIHVLHKDSTSANGGCDLTGCHDFGKQAFYATKRSCGSGGTCHTTYNLNNYFITHTNSAEVAAHAPTAGNVLQSGDTSYQGIACDGCHIVTSAQGGLVSYEHTSTYSQQTISGTNSCINCHNNANSTTAIGNDWSAKDTSGACAACHTGTLAIHTDANSTAHTTVTGANCASTGVGCHNTADLSSVGATATAANTVLHNSCLRCHSRTGAAAWSNSMIGTAGNVKFNPNVESCGQATGCHTSTYYTAAGVHRALTTNINGNDTLAHGASGMASVLTSGSASSSCAACHSSTLLAAHDPAKTTAALGSAHTAWSSTAATTCQDCHNATVAPTAGAAAQVKGHWTNNLCSDCHATYHNTLNSHAGTGVGCVNTGAGCHATADLRALHSTRTDGCVLTGCHNAIDKAMNSAPKDCMAVGCHAAYTSTNHGTTTGNDSTHQALSMTTKVDGTTYDAGGGNTCSACHGALTNAHAEAGPTSSLGSGNSAWTGGQTVCLDCHNNAIAPVAGASTVVNSDWNTGAKLCTNCHTVMHNTYTLAKHTTTTGASCALGGCHGGTTDVRELHNRGTTGGCTAYGVDGKLDPNTTQNKACHQMDKQMTPITTTPMSCGTGSAVGTTQCHINHTASNHAISNGAVDCTGCHFNASGTMTNMQPMINDTGTYHHVLDYAGGAGYAPGAGAYPTDQANLACVSCHVDHDKFNATVGRARNLRTTINGTSATATNTDFINGGDYGICVSCHSIGRTRKTSGVATGQASNGSTTTPAISGSRYALSAHNYSVPTSSGPGGAKDQFNANCSKCHDDENDAKSTMDTTRTIGLHFSSSSGLARALGATLPAGSHTVEENLCYRCHGTDASPTVAGMDGYGVRAMTARARDIKRSYNSLYKHAVASSTATGRHKADEYDRAPQTISPTMSVPGWYGPMSGGQQALRHSECEDCHNPHVARAEETTEFPDKWNPRGSSAVTISPANEGVWGVNIIGPNNVSTNGNWAGSGTRGVPKIPVYTKLAESQYEWQFCLKCHSRYAWGNTATPTVPSGTITGSQGFMTDVGRDFDTANHAYHPLFQTGRNQPPISANGNWTKTTSTIRRWDPTTNAFVTGLSNTFVDGWFATSRVTCSDCHGNEKWGGGLARGVHGASRKWLVRAVNTGIVTTRGNNGSSPALTNATFSEKAQCTNCHRGDVYGDSDSDDPTTTYSILGRGNHGSGFTSCDAETKVPRQINGCNNCHAGRNAPTDGATIEPLNGANHGSSCVQGADNTSGDPDALAFRFCNGASWDAHTFGRSDLSIGCSTVNASTNYSTCTQHTGADARTTTALYPY